MTGSNSGKRIGELSGPIFFSLVACSVSHLSVSFFSEKILIRCCKAARFPSPIYLIGVSCAGFQKLSYIDDCLCDDVCCWHEGHFC